MKKPPKKAKPPAVIPGGPMKKPAPAARVIPGGPMKTPGGARPAPAARVIPGGPMKKPAGHKKPAAHKKPAPRKLAHGGGNCVTEACHAATGYRLALDDEEGLLIPGVLEILRLRGVITGYAPAGDGDLHMPGLILGVDLPGPHAVLTVPGGWWSWGEVFSPAAFPDAVIEEAWQVTW